MADNNTTTKVVSTGTSEQESDIFFNMSRMRRIIANMKNYIDTRISEKAGAEEVEEMLEIKEYL